MRIQPRIADAPASCSSPAVAAAHHGSAISYNTTGTSGPRRGRRSRSSAPRNPHPTMKFDRTTKDGMVEHWVSELLTNPSVLVRAGWTRARSNEALKARNPSEVVSSARRAPAGTASIVMKIENEKGETIVGRSGGRQSGRRLDGVPDGLQPKGEKKLPGQPTGGRVITHE